jgi:hypothetical protein
LVQADRSIKAWYESTQYMGPYEVLYDRWNYMTM